MESQLLADYATKSHLRKQLAEVTAERDKMKDCLEDLVDHQNGPPLPSLAKRWREIMDTAAVLLGRRKT